MHIYSILKKRLVSLLSRDCQKYVKPRICARIFVRVYLSVPNSFPTGKLEEDYELRGTDYVQEQIFMPIFA